MIPAKYPEYKELSINQKISLKGLFIDRRNRNFLSHRAENEEGKKYEFIYLIALAFNWEAAINFFLNGTHPECNIEL